MRRNKGAEGWTIPTVITPTDFFCLKLRVPNQSEHLDALYGALNELAYWFNWRKDGTNKAAQTAQNWQKWLLNMTVSDECDMSLIYDLRQNLITIEKKVLSTDDWSLLYDPSPYVILKSPGGSNHNIISAPATERGLWAIQAGGEMALVGSQTGSTGRVGLLSHNNPANTDTVLQLERPTTNGSYLDVRVNSLTLPVINRYGQLKTILYSGVLPTANIDTYGAIIYLVNSENPTDYPDGAYIGNHTGAGYFWSAFAGTNGITPEDPVLNFRLFYLDWWDFASSGWSRIDPAVYPNEDWSLAVPVGFLVDQTATDTVELHPNESPFVQFVPHIDPTLPDEYVAFQFGLPRAPTIDLLETIPGEPGSAPSVARTVDTNGDTLFQFTLPTTAATVPCIDVVPPTDGTSKTYQEIVTAVSGVIVPFLVPAGCTLESITPVGLWSVLEPGDPIGSAEFVCNADGYGSNTPVLDGTLEYGLMLPSETVFDFFPYTELPVTLESDTYIRLRQFRHNTTFEGHGRLCVEYVISRATPPPEPGRYRMFAEVGENCVIDTFEYLGDDTWHLTAHETTGNPAAPGRVALSLHDHDSGDATVCEQFTGAVFNTWTPAGTHNKAVQGSCSAPYGTISDDSDTGATWMNGLDPVERFDLKWISGTVDIQFTHIVA